MLAAFQNSMHTYYEAVADLVLNLRLAQLLLGILLSGRLLLRLWS